MTVLFFKNFSRPNPTAASAAINGPDGWPCAARDSAWPVEPDGSACCYWNDYGTQCNHPARGLAWPVEPSLVANSRQAGRPSGLIARSGSNASTTWYLPPSRVDQHAAIGTATGAVQPPGSRTSQVRPEGFDCGGLLLERLDRFAAAACSRAK